MDAIEIFLIIIVDLLAFFIGLAIGGLINIRQQKEKSGSALKRNSDWQALMNYTPCEPTEKSADLYKQNAGKEKRYGRKNRNHTR